MSRRPKVVAMGGGTGLSTMLRGLKNEDIDLTAIVAVTDNGGGSGVLRRELGMLPPGDVRNCIQALANTEPTMEALLGYRFSEGSLKGQSLGNLFLAALNDICGSFDEAVRRLCEVLAITGRVLPVSNANVQLCAGFTDGAVIEGQCQIADYKKTHDVQIERIGLTPERPTALPECLAAIREADLLLLGPGSLYTSVLPNLLVEGVSDAIRESRALKLYIMNLMTQNGETEGYSAADHIRTLFTHGGPELFDHCLLNSLPIPPDKLPCYTKEGASPVTAEAEELAKLGITLHRAEIAAWGSGLIRHDSHALARAILRLYREISPTKVYR